jgi:hypothetical protein
MRQGGRRGRVTRDNRIGGSLISGTERGFVRLDVGHRARSWGWLRHHGRGLQHGDTEAQGANILTEKTGAHFLLFAVAL